MGGRLAGAIYHHVGGKPALLAACHLRALELASALQREANGLAGPRTAAMAAFQHGWATTLMQLTPLFPLTGFESPPRAGQEAFHDQVRALTDLTLQMVKAGIAEGELRPLDLYALRLQGGLLGWLAQAGIADPARQETIAQEAAAQLLLGVRALP